MELVDDDSCAVVLDGRSLDAVAKWLYAFDVDFTVLDPPDLRDACRALAERHTLIAARYRRA